MTGPDKTPLSAEHANLITSDVTRYTVQPLLLALMITAQCAGFVALFEIYVDDRYGLALTILNFAVSLAGVYGSIWLVTHGGYVYNRITHRTGEFFIVVIVSRVASWLISGTWPDLATLGSYVYDPVSFFDLPFVIMTLVLAVAWMRGLTLSAVFCSLAINEGEVRDYISGDPNRTYTLRVTRNRTPILASYIATWIIGGAVLLVCAVITQLEVPAEGASWLQFRDTPLRGDLVFALLAYTGIGVVLMSQGRLSAIHHHWLAVGMRTRNMTGRRWQRSSLGLMAVIMVAVAFLPWSSTIGMDDAVMFVLNAIYKLIIVFNGVIILALNGLYTLFNFEIFDLGQHSMGSSLPEANMEVPAPENLERETASNGMWTGLLAWLLIGFIVFFAIRAFLRNREFDFSLESLRRLWRAFSDKLQALFHGVSGEVVNIRNAVQGVLRTGLDDKPQDAKSPAARPWHFTRVSGLPPRERVWHFYTSALRQAKRRGVERQQHRTPLEFAEDMTERWPDAREDVAALTEAFLKARYSRAEIVDTDASAAETIWKRLRSVLKRRS